MSDLSSILSVVTNASLMAAGKTKSSSRAPAIATASQSEGRVIESRRGKELMKLLANK
jgi:hypothetical protein